MGDSMTSGKSKESDFLITLNWLSQGKIVEDKNGDFHKLTSYGNIKKWTPTGWKSIDLLTNLKKLARTGRFVHDKIPKYSCKYAINHLNSGGLIKIGKEYFRLEQWTIPNVSKKGTLLSANEAMHWAREDFYDSVYELLSLHKNTSDLEIINDHPLPIINGFDLTFLEKEMHVNLYNHYEQFIVRDIFIKDVEDHEGKIVPDNYIRVVDTNGELDIETPLTSISYVYPNMSAVDIDNDLMKGLVLSYINQSGIEIWVRACHYEHDKSSYTYNIDLEYAKPNGEEPIIWNRCTTLTTVDLHKHLNIKVVRREDVISREGNLIGHNHVYLKGCLYSGAILYSEEYDISLKIGHGCYNGSNKYGLFAKNLQSKENPLLDEDHWAFVHDILKKALLKLPGWKIVWEHEKVEDEKNVFE